MKKKANRTTDAQASAPGSPGRLTALAAELQRVTGGRGPLWRYAVRLFELYLAVNRATGARKAALQARYRAHLAAGVKRGYVVEHLA